MRLGTALVLPFLLAACGGGGSDGNLPDAPPNPYSGRVGGTVAGLSGSGLVLQVSQGGETLAIQKDGTFSFPTSYPSGTRYDVKVLAPPKKPAQICAVDNGAGSIAQRDFLNVTVSCYDAPLFVRGSVSGLRGSMGVWLRLHAAAAGDPLKDYEDVQVSADGSFAFSRVLKEGMAYEVTVDRQPSTPKQSCVVANGTGTIEDQDATTPTITCTTATFKLGGTVTGLRGQGLVLRNNDGNDLAIAANGAFTFDAGVEDGSTFSVKVATQPSHISQTCFVAYGAGLMMGADLTGVQVTCNASQQLGTDGDDEARAVISDADGNLYVAGVTTGSFGGPNAGGTDGFLIKLDWEGVLLWKRQFGSAGDDNINAISFSSTGDLYLVGSTTGNVDSNTNVGDADILIAKYDKNGNKLWTRSLGSTGSDVAYNLRVRSTALYLVGATTGSLDGATTPGGTDLFTAKLDTNGAIVWVRQMGTPAFDAAYGIDIDPSNVIYVAGGTLGNLDGHANTSGGEVGFLLQYDDAGTLQSSDLFCQMDCFGPATQVQSRFNSVSWVVGMGAVVAGWTQDDQPNYPNQQFALLATYNSGSWLGRGEIRLDEPYRGPATHARPSRRDALSDRLR